LHVEAGSPRSTQPQQTRAESPTHPKPSTPEEPLTPEQHALDQRLRDWRKSEAERLGLPQFFVFGTSTLRSVVLKHPRTLDQLRSVAGIGPEKLEKYGASILAVCNA
jgi:ATP-dependent DNA helicase RecQ